MATYTSSWDWLEGKCSSVADRLESYAARLNQSGLSKKEAHLIKALIQECLRQMKPKKKKRGKSK